jgi:murein L,D-transpeptidase YafK
MLACSVADIFNCVESTVHRKKQLTVTAMPKMIELAVMQNNEWYKLLTPKYSMQYYSFKKSDSRNILRLVHNTGNRFYVRCITSQESRLWPPGM